MNENILNWQHQHSSNSSRNIIDDGDNDNNNDSSGSNNNEQPQLLHQNINPALYLCVCVAFLWIYQSVACHPIYHEINDTCKTCDTIKFNNWSKTKHPTKWHCTFILLHMWAVYMTLILFIHPAFVLHTQLQQGGNNHSKLLNRMLLPNGNYHRFV